jgi:hypothetical protein
MNFIRHKPGLAAIVVGLGAGLSMTNERGDWQGIDFDLCHAVADEAPARPQRPVDPGRPDVSAADALSASP